MNFDLAGPKNNKPGYYDWDYNNFAPRVAVAWTPRAEDGFFGWLTGNGKMAVRGGYSIVYDRIGTALASNFDKEGSFGMATNLSSPYGGHNEDDPSIRFQGIDWIPPTLPAAPPGGFPQTPPQYANVITSALDGTIVTPYNHTFNVVVGRELGKGFSFEAAYVGRRGRNLLVRRDAAMPANLKDPASGLDYFTAVGQLIGAAQGIDGGAPLSAYSGIASQPYWENMFPGAAGNGLSATQMMAAAFNAYAPDYISALFDADQFCDPSCSKLGEFAFFTTQYDTLGIQSTIAQAEYDAMQVSLRKRFSEGYQFDVNYTLGSAKDHGSLLEGDATFGNFDNGGYTGFLIDSWDPDKQYGRADFDVRHLVNFNWIAEVPVGRGKRFGADMPGVLDAIARRLVDGRHRPVEQRLPVQRLQLPAVLVHELEPAGQRRAGRPGAVPETSDDAQRGERLSEPVCRRRGSACRCSGAPGRARSGLRNQLEGDGYFSIDFSLSKGWTLPWSSNHKLRFRWDTFNVTNTPKFDVFFMDMFPDREASFGRYYETIATCDGGAGRCMQFALKYEF